MFSLIDVLLQVHIADEDTKFGWSPGELKDFMAGRSGESSARIKGLMGMATNTRDEAKVRSEFARLKILFDQLKANNPDMDTLSMGMSADYTWAVDEGSTMVRIGSDIFGARNY